jgi:hypothetical protein
LRKTRGWHKDSDFISYSQIRELGGIASNATVQKAVGGLINKGLILIDTGDPSRSNQYKLNRDYVTVTETVKQPITESVTPPITESVNTKDISFKDIKLTGDLFDDCMVIYETLKGYPITAANKFSEMITNFKKNGVTAADYYESIVDQDASGKYPRANKPTSYESWTLTHAEKRRNPLKARSGNFNFTPNKQTYIGPNGEEIVI